MTATFLTAAMSIMAEHGYDRIVQYINNSVHVGRNVLAQLPDALASYKGQGVLIADSNTVQLLKRNVVDHMPHYVIQGQYIASEELVTKISEAAARADFVVALGSGTINDLCKHVSITSGKDYVLFPTAPSMNGYTSPNASITSSSGIKKSVPGKLPTDIFIDIDVLSAAPKRMINSGFADFVCRSTARADWLLSHILLGTTYNELPFQMTEEIFNALMADAVALSKQDGDAVMQLMYALLLSGFGMLIVGGSQSASQGEHMVASATELLDDNDFLHGERIGVATVLMSRLQKVICGTRPKLSATALDQGMLCKYFNNMPYAEEFCDTLSKKRIDAQKAEYLNDVIQQKWHLIVEMVAAGIINSEKLSNTLHVLGGPYLPEHIGWATEDYNSIANISFATRDRFTFLDVAHHAGIKIA